MKIVYDKRIACKQYFSNIFYEITYIPKLVMNNSIAQSMISFSIFASKNIYV